MTAVMIMAGGTGGHVYPALAVAEHLREDNHEVCWLGTQNGLEATVVPRASINIDWIRISGIRGRGLLAWLVAPFNLVRAVWQAATVIRQRRPAVVLGMGGFVAGPGGIAAWLLRKPLVIHEQNAVAGLTNRWLAPLATSVLEAFPGSFDEQHGARCVGNPVRREIVAVPAPEQRMAGRSGRTRLLVLGGSQGALVLNETVPRALALIDESERPRVWHQAGRHTLNIAERAYAEYGVDAEVESFIIDMANAYAWADLVICRAGALTVAELSAVGVGAILVPYPGSIDDHQTLNAQFLEKAGAGLIAPQSGLTPEGLAAALQALMSDRSKLADMAQCARAGANADATSKVSAACLVAARGVQS